MATKENLTTTGPSRHRQHNNYGGGNQFNIESIVLNVNAPSRFGIESAAADDHDDEEEEEAVADDRIGRDEESVESSPFESEEYDYDAGSDSRWAS